jgi:hypothetical protein
MKQIGRNSLAVSGLIILVAIATEVFRNAVWWFDTIPAVRTKISSRRRHAASEEGITIALMAARQPFGVLRSQLNAPQTN